MTQSVEQWRPIPGWEGEYEASDQGRIRSLDHWVLRWSKGRKSQSWYLVKGKVKKGTLYHQCGYEKLWLKSASQGKKECALVHRLIWMAFNGEVPEGMCVLHGPLKRDGGIADNRLSNLYLGTHQQNMGPDRVRDDTISRGSRHAATKLNEDDVRIIRLTLEDAPIGTARKLAQRYEVPESVISNIKHRKTWRHVA